MINRQALLVFFYGDFMFDIIAKSFQDLTVKGWISQIFGLIGLIIIGISYLFRKKTFLIVSSFSFVFFIVEQLLVDLYANLIVTVICFSRNLLMGFFLIKYNKQLPRYFVFALIGAMWLGVIIYMAISNTFNVWDNYLPASIVTMSTFTQNSKNEFVVKSGAAIHEFGFLVYYLIYALPFSILRQAILVISALIGLIILTIRYFKNKNKEIEEIAQ